MSGRRRAGRFTAQPERRKRVALFAIAAIAYVMAAWAVAPGFYDGFAPPEPYCFVSPPPQAAGSNCRPKAGHQTINVIRGVSDANSAYTNDGGQLVIGFLPGAFDVTGKTSVSVDITPEATFPDATGLRFVTNVYLVTADAPLVKDANIVLRYSDLVPDPSAIYFAPSAGGTWTSIGAAPQSQYWTKESTTHRLGYFAAGYPANVTPRPGAVTVGGGQILPIVVAVVIVVVVLAGLPLAMLRRRRAVGAEEEPDDDES